MTFSSLIRYLDWWEKIKCGIKDFFYGVTITHDLQNLTKFQKKFEHIFNSINVIR